jgi:hypothetical protein
MEDNEIEQRIAALSEEDRGWLYHICEIRYEHRNVGAAVAEYVDIPASAAKVLGDVGLAWLIGQTHAAAIHPVYDYYVRTFKEPRQTPRPSAHDPRRSTASHVGQG